MSLRQIFGKNNNVEKPFLKDFKKYNWVDVKEFAKNIFRNYSFEMPWAEDAWNILMFNDVVKTDNVTSSKYEIHDYGDIILWLVAMYDLFYEYKLAGDYETSDDEDFKQYISRIDKAENYIGIYLKNKIFEELNNQLIESKCDKCEFYDVKADNFIFCNDKYRTSIAYKVYFDEIHRRREIIKEKIDKYFRSNEIMISQFMEGTHWCEFYFDKDKKVQKIVTKYEKILKQVQEGKAVRCTVGDSEFEYTNEDKVNDDMNNELEKLQNEMEALKSNAQRPEVYSWISNVMNLQ